MRVLLVGNIVDGLQDELALEAFGIIGWEPGNGWG